MGLRAIDWTQIDTENVPNGTTVNLGSETIPLNDAFLNNLEANGDVQVDGNVGIGGEPTNDYKLEVHGSIGATSYYETSDVTLKEIIRKNPDIDLSKLDVIQYRFIGDYQVRYGYSAQEVQKLCDDLVVGTKPMKVNYNDVHTLLLLQLTNKIKELEKKVKELECRLGQG